MRKFLIFTTIVLLFALATQEKVHNKTKKNKTKTFNNSKLFNLTKICKRGEFLNTTTKKCQKFKKPVRTHFKFVNQTNCTKGYKLHCTSKKNGNKTSKFCTCRVQIPAKRTYRPLKPVCPKGYVYKCDYGYSSGHIKYIGRIYRRPKCSCQENTKKVDVSYSCPEKFSLRCKKNYLGIENCECVESKE